MISQNSHLESIPGIGKTTAPIILAEIGDINNFSSPSMHDYYIKKRSQGKHHYVALAGVERKLLGIIYHVLKENRDYQPPKLS